jgi:hypothetical protein
MSELLIYSLLIWQVILGIWLLLKWIKTNIKFHRSPVLNIGESLQSGSPIGKSKVKKDLGPIEVDVKKQIVITEADENTIKSDEVITGKVKTKKDKLKKLRGK